MSAGIKNKVLPREIYIIDVRFEDIDGYKTRPVLILYQQSNIITIAPITHVAPTNPPIGYYDEAKEPINRWRKYGLHQKSWVECASVKKYDDSIFEHKHPIGTMDLDEFDRITEKICWYM